MVNCPFCGNAMRELRLVEDSFSCGSCFVLYDSKDNIIIFMFSNYKFNISYSIKNKTLRAIYICNTVLNKTINYKKINCLFSRNLLTNFVDFMVKIKTNNHAFFI